MFTLTIETDNAAFQGGTGREEVVRLLLDVAGRLTHGETDGRVRDINGNTVGEFKTTA